MIVETRFKAFLGNFSKVPSIKETQQQLIMNWQCNNRFLFKHFNSSKHSFCFLPTRFNSLYDLIMLPGTINTVFSYHKSLFDNFFKNSNTFTKSIY